MTEVLFYHLERAQLEDVLPDLLEKSLERGWRAVVKTGEPDRLEALDARLWTYRDDSFLPHSASGDGSDQPIWLTAGEDRPNRTDVLFLVEDAAAEPTSIDGLARCVVIFNGRDESAIEKARSFWRSVNAAGLAATYWKQSPEGRWQKQN